jgi:hypothetical protein
MANITVASRTLDGLLWQGKTPPRLRAFPRKPFTSAAGVLFVAGRPWASCPIYLDVRCIVSAGVVTIPSFTIVSTLDALDYRDSAWDFFFCGYDLAEMPFYSPFSVFQGIRIPASPTSIVWADLV